MQDSPEAENWPIDDLWRCARSGRWKEFVDRLTPLGLGAFCDDALNGRLVIPETLSLYGALINRLRDLGHMSLSLSDEQRAAAIEYPDMIHEYTKKRFQNNPEGLSRLQAAILHSETYYDLWGTPVMRQFLYDRGLLDQFGVELDDPYKSTTTLEHETRRIDVND